MYALTQGFEICTSQLTNMTDLADTLINLPIANLTNNQKITEQLAQRMHSWDLSAVTNATRMFASATLGNNINLASLKIHGQSPTRTAPQSGSIVEMFADATLGKNNNYVNQLDISGVVVGRIGEQDLQHLTNIFNNTVLSPPPLPIEPTRSNKTSNELVLNLSPWRFSKNDAFAGGVLAEEIEDISKFGHPQNGRIDTGAPTSTGGMGSDGVMHCGSGYVDDTGKAYLIGNWINADGTQTDSQPSNTATAYRIVASAQTLKGALTNNEQVCLVDITDLSTLEMASINSSHFASGQLDATAISQMQNWDLSNLENAEQLFKGITFPATTPALSLAAWTSVTNATAMFQDATLDSAITLANFTPANHATLKDMFKNATLGANNAAIPDMDVSHVTATNTKTESVADMFDNTTLANASMQLDWTFADHYQITTEIITSMGVPADGAGTITTGNGGGIKSLDDANRNHTMPK